jgi:O2-independent ubiquinone biosynthesis accessory factor UbiT
MMMENPQSLPPLMATLSRQLPLFPMEALIGAILPRIVARHPRIIDRLTDKAQRRFAIAPTDLSIVFLLQPDPGAPRITVLRDLAGCQWDALIAGPLLSLLDLARGKLDGDALLFSREIRIEGDIEAILALRNALDAEGVDLLAEGAELCGPLAPFAFAMADGLDRLARQALGVLQGSSRRPTGAAP